MRNRRDAGLKIVISESRPGLYCMSHCRLHARYIWQAKAFRDLSTPRRRRDKQNMRPARTISGNSRAPASLVQYDVGPWNLLIRMLPQRVNPQLMLLLAAKVLVESDEP